jgi:hypothetical protein
MPRFLIRPRDFKKTPKRLSELLGTQRTITYTGHNNIIPDWSLDFFLSYRFPSSEVLNATEDYTRLHLFYCSSKRDQRTILAEDGIKVPNSYPSEKYIVRPLRHFAGRDYRVTEDDSDFDPQLEYLSPWFPKTSEYRIIYSKGQPIVTLLKRVPEGLSNLEPWNHDNGSSFVSIHQHENNRLRHTTVYQDLSRSKIIQSAHLTAIDVLYCKQQRLQKPRYAVCEVNFCPSLTIPDNLERLQSYVHSSFEAA